MEKIDKEVCWICRHTAYICKCKGCIYDVLNSKNKKDDKKLNDNSVGELLKKNGEQDG